MLNLEVTEFNKLNIFSELGISCNLQRVGNYLNSLGVVNLRAQKRLAEDLHMSFFSGMAGCSHKTFQALRPKQLLYCSCKQRK